MKTLKTDAILTDAKNKGARRYRNILANSGDIMESGEIRSLNNLYVMGRDAKLLRIADLNKNPEKQTEEYSVKAQADHGDYDALTGELVPTIEKQFGSCRVWLEDDGLHARMYFADNDKLADHAFAISEDASYSTGMDIYPDGYQGAGNDINEPLGILREISMVLTGNDPRAKTIDQKPANAQAHRGADAGNGKNIKEQKMQKDNLTPDEAVALKEQLVAKIDEEIAKFTTEAPESEAESTAEDAKDEAPEAPAEDKAEAKAEAEKPAEEKQDEPEAKEEKEMKEEKDALHMPNLAIKDRAPIKQEYNTMKDESKITVADALRASKGLFDATFKDKVTGLVDPCGVAKAFDDALEKSDGLINYFTRINTKQFTQNLATGEGEAARAGGHKKDDKKSDQELKIATRNILTKMAYKKLSFDAMEVYENPELVPFRAKELADSIIVEIERAAISGDGRSVTSPDRRMFDGTRGFRSIAEDAAHVGDDDFSKLVADVYEKQTKESFRAAVAGAKGKIYAEGKQILVTKRANITALMQAEDTTGHPLVNTSIEQYLGVDKVFAPKWMDEDKTNEAYVLVAGAYGMIGEAGIRSRADFDVTLNQDVLLDETPRGGALIKAHSAVAIKNAAA